MISVGVHVLLAGAWWLVEVSPEPPPIEDVAPAKIELVERTETAVEVVMLDAQQLAQVPGLAAEPPIATAAPTRAASRIAANSRVTRAPEVVRPTEPVITHTPSPFSDFRKGRAVVIARQRYCHGCVEEITQRPHSEGWTFAADTGSSTTLRLR